MADEVVVDAASVADSDGHYDELSEVANYESVSSNNVRTDHEYQGLELDLYETIPDDPTVMIAAPSNNNLATISIQSESDVIVGRSTTDWTSINVCMAAIGLAGLLLIATSSIAILVWFARHVSLPVYQTSTKTIQDSWDIFSAQATYPKTTDTATPDIVQFTHVDFNYAQSFNGSVFQPKTDGYFFFHLSYGKQRNGSLNVDLKDANDVALIQLQTSRQSVMCSISANHLVHLNRDQPVHVTSSTPVDYNNTDLLPTLVGFRFDNQTMEPFVAWQQEYQPIKPAPNQKFIGFEHTNSTTDCIEVNFNTSTTTDTQIRVPFNGIYVVSITLVARHIMSSPKDPQESVSLGFSTNKISNIRKSLKMIFYVDDLIGDNNVTTTLFYVLNISTTEHMELTYSRKTYKSELSSQSKLYLLLLLYSPAHGERVAWAMRLCHSNPIWNAKDSLCVIDVCINVNVSCQNGVDLNNLTASNRVNVTYAGLYYIALTVEHRSSLGPNVCVRVTKPIAIVQLLMCLAFETKYEYSINRAGIWRLNASDEVSVYGTILSQQQILFSAFMLSSS